MKKITLLFSALLLCGVSLCFTGCGNTVTYYSCEDKYEVGTDGWKRGIESNEIITNLSSMGLDNVAYDFSYVKEQGFGLDTAENASFVTFAKNNIGNMKSDTIKFENVNYFGFYNYAEYLFTDFSAIYNTELAMARSVDDLITRNEQGGLVFYEYKSFLKHGSKYYSVEIFYVQSGNNSAVSAMEMYVTVPVYLKNKLNGAQIVTRFGDVVETWPGWTHLNYAKTPMYRYIPSIYSEYYEVSEIDGLTQIYVPNYTRDMINFYEKELKDANFVAGDLDACEPLANIVKKSVGHTNVSYFTYTMVNNIWHLAVFENKGYMQISAYLSTRNRIEIDLNAAFPEGNTFESYDDFQRAFNKASGDLGISIPYKNYAFIDSYYITTFVDRLDNEGLKVGFKTTSNTPYSEYKAGIENIMKELYRDFINQGAGLYVDWSNSYTIRKQIEGLDNYFYEMATNLKVFEESQYNYTFKETDNREVLIDAIQNGSLIYNPETNSWQFPPYLISGHNYLGTDENDRIIYEFDYYVTYTIKKFNTVSPNFADLVYANADLQQNILDAEVLSGYIDGLPIIIQKQDNYIYFTELTANTLEESYREVVFFQDESARLEFEKNKTLLGNETLYTSSGISGELSENLTNSKIISYLHKFYALQTESQSLVDEYISRYVGDEEWMFKFVEENIHPSSQTAILQGQYIDVLPAYSESGLGSIQNIWFSSSSLKIPELITLNFNAYYGENGKLKFHIYATADDELFKAQIDGKEYYNCCNKISDTTPVALYKIVQNFIQNL